MLAIRQTVALAYISSIYFISFLDAGTSTNIDLYVVLYDFVTLSGAHLESASDFRFHRQRIFKNFLRRLLEGRGVILAMSKCDGDNRGRDAKARAKDHLYFVDDQTFSRADHLIDSMTAEPSSEALLGCLDDASDYIFDLVHGGARSDAQRVCLILHRQVPIVLNATFYDKMRSLKSKFNMRTILAVNDYNRDNLTMETYTKKVAELLNVDQMIVFDGREDSATKFVGQFWSALKNPSISQVSARIIDCIVATRETVEPTSEQGKCNCATLAIILQHPSVDGRPCPSSLINRTRECSCPASSSRHSENEPFVDVSMEPGTVGAGQSDSSIIFLIVALILLCLAITSIGFLWYLMHKKRLAQIVGTKKLETSAKTPSKTKGSTKSLSAASTGASPSTSATAAKPKTSSKLVLLKKVSAGKSRKSTADVKVNSMSDTLLSTTSSLLTKSKRTFKDGKKKSSLFGKKKTFMKMSVRSEPRMSIGQKSKKVIKTKSLGLGSTGCPIHKSVKGLGQK